jgi:hemerythrin-like metal-binding protein/PAS domain S-box-containing protein
LSNRDILGNALLEMRKSLKHADEEEKNRKIEDEKQNWATQGLAKFGEILRTNSNNIEELAFNFMSNLINYLDVNQGALFVIDDNNDGELALELKSAIAYGRDKYIRKRVNVGEELVGRCAFEKKTIYMTDIPDDYIQITSGMGTANPTALLLVPLILNDEIFGVIELASFHTIEKYRIEFVEKLGESIASTIATVRVNEKTNKLLEQSKGQAEELAAQEEEMRQNLEELQATQEEAARREYETTGIINAVGVVAFTVEYDLEGVIVNCNNKFADMLGLSPEQIIGQKHSQGYEFSDEMKASYDKFWSDLLKGKTIRQTNKIKMNGREAWIDETYTPIKNQSDGKTYKILKIGFDVTEQIQKESKIKDQEIKIKKESMLLSEYQDRIHDLQKQLQAAQQRVKDLEKNHQDKNTDKHKEEEVLIIPATGDNLLDWTADFELGIQEMDGQHKQLIDLVNTMHASLKQGKNKKEVKDNIRSFVDFASYHFGNEEQYFEQFGFDNTKEHTQEHKAFVKEILQFQSDYSANKIKFLDDLMQYIKKWLHKHFSITDKKYAELFKQNGL